MFLTPAATLNHPRRWEIFTEILMVFEALLQRSSDDNENFTENVTKRTGAATYIQSPTSASLSPMTNSSWKAQASRAVPRRSPRAVR